MLNNDKFYCFVFLFVVVVFCVFYVVFFFVFVGVFFLGGGRGGGGGGIFVSACSFGTKGYNTILILPWRHFC